MAETESKIRKKVLKISPLRSVEKKFDEKGFSVAENVAKATRERKEGKREKKQLIGKQKQVEELRLAETEDLIARRGQIGQTGGRQSLIKSRKRLKQVQGAQALIPRS